MAKILLIDDDPNLLDVLSMDFEESDYEVVTAMDGADGYDTIKESRPDLVISDVNMPRLDGFSLCRKLRADGNQVPIVLLTSRDSEIDEALGLDLGADDYISKPFSTRVLLARTAAILRREASRSGGEQPKPSLVCGDLSLDAERLEVTYCATKVEMTVTEFRLLELLLDRPGMVFSRTRILDALRGDDVVVTDRVVDTYIRRLRRKLQAVNPDFNDIDTVIGAGYRWRA